ncbi:hypothetical protein MUK42_30258 [Musa troglodytarum]|uniref:Uncharacterized protein n=1 Tax=Musa troglodytarum TaxID=320322 RepID=A0A9E7JZ72_9LILI|nr:hypothetical protein MUK42_30258 [Musa troglodytarum]
MKCTQHPLEGGVGVCAPCLSERLLALTATVSPAVHSPDHQRLKDSPRSPSPPPHPLPCASRTAASSRRSSIVSMLFGRRGSVNRNKQPQRPRFWLSTLPHGRRSKNMGVSDAELLIGPRRTKPPREATEEHYHRHGIGLAGFAMCCSPLVTARPCRQRSRVAELGFACETPRAALGPHHRRHASAGGPLLFPDRSPRMSGIR